MEQNNNLDFTNNGGVEGGVGKIIVPGVGVLEMEEAKRLASIEKVANILVDDEFGFERLSDLRRKVEECKNSGIFSTEKELENYNGFVNTIEKIVRVREAIKEKEQSQTEQVLH